jgi:hypothetical protein
LTRTLLNILNPVILILLVLLGVALQTSLFVTHPLSYLQPDVILLATLWCALYRSFTEGGFLTLAFGNIAEIHSASPQGLFLCTYMLVFLGICALSRYAEVRSSTAFVLLSFFSSFFWKFSSLVLLHFMGLGFNQWRHTLFHIVPGAIMVSLLSIWIYRFLRWVDRVTFKGNTPLEE